MERHPDDTFEHLEQEQLPVWFCVGLTVAACTTISGLIYWWLA